MGKEVGWASALQELTMWPQAVDDGGVDVAVDVGAAVESRGAASAEDDKKR